MRSDPAEFWLRRYLELRHTGWKDPIIYAYDQIERLGIVSRKVDSLDVAPLLAFDFGCGSGDFSRLLLEKGFKVWGYDPYVEPKIVHPDFTYIKEPANVDILDLKVGIILSVTVLDHIVDDDDFQTALRILRTKVAEQGVFLMIEYATDEPVHSSCDYQAFRTIDRWQKALANAGWNIVTSEPVPHPSESPSSGFRCYKKSMFVRLLGTLLVFPFLVPYVRLLLARYAEEVLNSHGVGDVVTSPLKFIQCRPV